MGWSTALQLGGLALGALGNYKNAQAEYKAQQQAQALQDQYKNDLQAWQDAQAGAGNARAMLEYQRQLDYWNRQREAELAVLKDKGATDAQLAAHEQKLAADFMENMKAFDPEALAAGIEENRVARQELQNEALDSYKATRDAGMDLSNSGFSQDYQDAMAEGMAEADATGSEYAEGMADLSSYGDAREGEQSALRDISLEQGYAGERAKALIEKLAKLRQDGLGYVVAPEPLPPAGGGGASGRPVEPSAEIKVPSKWGWVGALGSVLGSVGSIFGAAKPKYSGSTSSGVSGQTWR